MIHKDREYRINKVFDEDDLCIKLTQYSWTGCTAFEMGGYIFANDGFDGGANEWCVLKRDGAEVIDLESLTLREYDRAKIYVRNVLNGVYKTVYDRFVLKEHKEGVCQHCA